MSIRAIQKQLNNNSIGQTMECLAEFCIEESVRNVKKEIGKNSIKNIEFKGFTEEHGIGVLNLRYNIIDNAKKENEEKNYVVAKVYVICALVENNMIFVRCFNADSLACCTITGKKLCNFGVEDFVEVIEAMIDDINKAIKK